MRRFSHITRWPRLLFALSFAVALIGATGTAQAVVVQSNNGVLGVAMVPGTGSQLASAGVPVVTASGACSDPQLVSTPDLGQTLPTNALCLHDLSASDGDTVLPKNETFAMSWDPMRWGWATTRGDLQQFLRDVADGSGSMTSPFSLTPQYMDALGKRAANQSLYGGGCIDLGNPGGYTCRYGTTNGSGVGNNYPTGDPVQNCTVTGAGNGACVTDAAVKQEVAFFANTTRFQSYTQPGYQPVVVMIMPPKLEVCLDSTGKLCSVGSNATAQFCSYHGYEQINGVNVAYVVQPFSAFTNCDEPNLPAVPNPATTVQVEQAAAVRIVAPLSSALIATIVNPWMTGWYAQDGSEINDNPYLGIDGCRPEGPTIDKEPVGSGSYVLPGVFNNGSTLSFDLNALPCPQWAVLNPRFVVPSPINAHDVVMFDGSVTNSNLVVPKLGYWWSFGDGTTAVGPSVEHSYAYGGTYTVTLTTIDRGAYVNTVQQQVVVAGPGKPGGNGGGGGGAGGGGGGGAGGGGTTSGLQVRLALTAKNSFQRFLRKGLSVQVTSNLRADGIVRLAISSRAAKRAHLKIAPGARYLIIGQGTVSGLVKAGTVTLQIHLSRATAARLSSLGSLDVTVRLTLHAPGYATKTFVRIGTLTNF